MQTPLHISSGDCANASLSKSGIEGEFFVWHDILYDGPVRDAGIPSDAALQERAAFLEAETGGGLSFDSIFTMLQEQYRKLQTTVAQNRPIVLWFDACLFDQSMLAHVLMCLHHFQAKSVQLLCIDSHPGIDPFHGTGQLRPEHFATLYPQRHEVTPEEYDFAIRVDTAFATYNRTEFHTLATLSHTSLPFIPKAVQRWLDDNPDSETELGKLDTLILQTVRQGVTNPVQIFKTVSEAVTPPQYWGDATLWKKINCLADRQLLAITGPLTRLPQWESPHKPSEFTVTLR